MSLPWRSVRCLVVLVLMQGCYLHLGSECAYLYPQDSTLSSSHHSIQTLPELEKTLKKAAKEAAALAGNTVVTQLTGLNVSPACEDAIYKWTRDLLGIHDWAVKLLDASGKPSAGMLEGTAAALGDYDECLDAHLPASSTPHVTRGAIQGQYCMFKINIPDVLLQAAKNYQAGNRSTSYLANTETFLRNFVKIAPRADIADIRLGVCTLSPCTIEDLENLISDNAKEFSRMVSILRCETKQSKELRVEQIAIMVVLGVVTFFVVLGTLIDTVLRAMANGPVDDVFFKKQDTYIQFLVSFSMGNNFRKLSELKMEDGQLSCTRGIKFLSVCLIIFVSTYAMPIDLHFLKYRNAFNIHKFIDQWWFALVANSSAGIDTLFFLAGLQITYNIWRKAAESSEHKVSINIVKFVIVWYSRLTASQLLVIALFLLFPLLGSGPLWGDVVIPEVEHCRNTWWMNALYINNFWPANETCLYHTWFVTTLMQMLIITPLLLWILNKWNVFGILLIFALILGSCIAVAMVTITSELPPAPSLYFVSFLNLRSIWDKMFIQVYDHLAPFCVGILMGYLIARRPKIVLRKITVTIGWSLAVACNLAIIFGLYEYRNGDPIELTLSAFYAAAHRFAWSLGIAWIVFACAYGYGGVISEFLSWKGFIPFERLSNLIYLFHPLVILYHSGQVRETVYFSHLDQIVYSLAYVCLTCIFAALCYNVFVIPFRFLESMAWKSKDRDVGQRHTNVSKVIAIKERITNDFNITMRDSPGRQVSDNNGGGIDNTAFTTS